LHLAAGLGNKDIVKLILSKDNRCTVDAFRRTPFIIALRNHQNDIFFQLIKETQSNFKRDYSNNTLLHYAAAYGNL
jgi:ankyrin repeat protein